MTSTSFDPKSDFVLPVTTFTTRLLADGIDEDTHAHIRNLHAGMIVLEKHMPWAEDVTEEEKTRILLDHTKDFWDIYKDLEDIVPAEIDIDAELAQARATIDEGKTTLNERVSVAILEKFLPKEVVDTSLQARAAIQLMAINDKLPGFLNLEPPIVKTEPRTLFIIQDVLNKTLQTYVSGIKSRKITADTQMLTPYSRVVAYNAIADSCEQFNDLDQGPAMRHMMRIVMNKLDTVETQYGYEESYNRYNHSLSKPETKKIPQPDIRQNFHETDYREEYQKFAFDNFRVDEKTFIENLLETKNIVSVNKEVKQACREIHAGMKIMAIYHCWKGYPDIQATEIQESDSDHTQKAQNTVNKLVQQIIPHMVEATKTAKPSPIVVYGVAAQKAYTRSMAYESMAEGATILEENGYLDASDLVDRYASVECFKEGIEKFGFDHAYNNVLEVLPDEDFEQDEQPFLIPKVS